MINKSWQDLPEQDTHGCSKYQPEQPAKDFAFTCFWFDKVYFHCVLQPVYMRRQVRGLEVIRVFQTVSVDTSRLL